MQRLLPICALLLLFAVFIQPAVARSCPDEGRALGVSRIIEIDVSGGPLFGAISHRKSEPNFLKPKEVVLTFDDGPSPRITNPILKILDDYCTKATFFAVGEMAMTYPETLKRIQARGHTLGAHTWSHPLNLKKLSLKRAVAQIEKGFEAVALAAGKPIAPFFRFPGLSDSRKMLDYLQERKIGTFTVDVVSDDSFISDPKRLARVTLSRIERHGGGIVLFHDIKRSTAKALPEILRVLKKRGYKIVHMKAKHVFRPMKRFEAKLKPKLAKKLARIARYKKAGHSEQPAAITHKAMPFYGTIGPGKFATMQEVGGPPVTELNPAPRDRLKRHITQKKTKVIRQKKSKRRKITARSQRIRRPTTTRVRLRGITLTAHRRMNLHRRRLRRTMD